MFATIRLPEKYLNEIKAAGDTATRKDKRAYGILLGRLDAGESRVVIERIYKHPLYLDDSAVDKLLGIAATPWYVPVGLQGRKYKKELEKTGRKMIIVDYETISSAQDPLPPNYPARIEYITDTGELEAISSSLNYLDIEIIDDKENIIILPKKSRKII